MLNWIERWWIDAAFGICLAVLSFGYRWVGKKVRRILEDEDATKRGTIALLRDRIIQAYNYYSDKKACPIYARDNILAMYKEYKTLGGNGTITGLVESLMKMPTDKENESEH